MSIQLHRSVVAPYCLFHITKVVITEPKDVVSACHLALRTDFGLRSASCTNIFSARLYSRCLRTASSSSRCAASSGSPETSSGIFADESSSSCGAGVCAATERGPHAPSNHTRINVTFLNISPNIRTNIKVQQRPLQLQSWLLSPLPPCSRGPVPVQASLPQAPDRISSIPGI